MPILDVVRASLRFRLTFCHKMITGPGVSPRHSFYCTMLARDSSAKWQPARQALRRHENQYLPAFTPRHRCTVSKDLNSFEFKAFFLVMSRFFLQLLFIFVVLLYYHSYCIIWTYFQWGPNTFCSCKVLKCKANVIKRQVLQMDSFLTDMFSISPHTTRWLQHHLPIWYMLCVYW